MGEALGAGERAVLPGPSPASQVLQGQLSLHRWLVPSLLM